jgi:hypothetical protein
MIFKLVLLSIVTASISFLITESKLFQFFRDWVKECPVFKCGFCFGHWIALALVIGFKYRLFETHWLTDVVFTTLTVAWIAGLQFAIMNLLITTYEKGGVVE